MMNETLFASGHSGASETEYLLQYVPPEERHPMFAGVQREAYKVAFEAISRVHQIDRSLAAPNEEGVQPQITTEDHLERAKVLSRVGLAIARHRLQVVDQLERAEDFDQTPLSFPWLTAQGYVAAPVLAAAAGINEVLTERQFAERWFTSVVRYENAEPVRYYGPEAVEFASSEMLVPHAIALRQLPLAESSLRLILERLGLPAVRHIQKDRHFSSVDDLAQVAEMLRRIPEAQREDMTAWTLARELLLPDTRPVINYYERRGITLELRQRTLANGLTTVIKIIPPEMADAFRNFVKTGLCSIKDIMLAAGLPAKAPVRDYLRPEEAALIEEVPRSSEHPKGSRSLPADVAARIIARIRAQHESRKLPEPTILPAHLIPLSVIKSRFVYPEAGLQRIIGTTFKPEVCVVAGKEEPCYPWKALQHIEQEIESRPGEIPLDYSRLPEGMATDEQEKYARSIQVRYIEGLKPPAFMQRVAPVAKEVKIPVEAAAGFLRDHGGEVRIYFAPDGEQELFTTELGVMLLRRQRLPVSSHPLPKNWRRRDEIAGATGRTVAQFDGWLNQHPEFLHRAEWRRRLDIENPPNLPYFSPAVVEQFVIDTGQEAM